MSSLVIYAKFQLQNTRETGTAQKSADLRRKNAFVFLQEHPPGGKRLV